MRFMGFVLGMCCFLCVVTTPARAMILLNEFLADPPAGSAGDANGDGVRSTTQDEFVEIYNSGLTGIDISGWYLKDADATRHVFANSLILSPQEVYVVFGGGNPTLSGFRWAKASTGSLSLNNDKDTISLFNSSNVLMDQIIYGDEANKDQSLTRSPEGENGLLVLHMNLPNANGRRFSPGYLVNPPVFNNTVVPEPTSLMTLAGGVFAGLLTRKKKSRRAAF